MSNKFLERFGCSTEQELYEKVQKRDKSVTELLNYIYYAKSNIRIKEMSINQPSILLDYLDSKVNLPTRDSASMLFVNTKGDAIHLTKFRPSRKAEVLGAIKEGIDVGAASGFLFVSGHTRRVYIDRIEEFMKTLDIKMPDVCFHIGLEDRSYLLSRSTNEKKYLDEDTHVKEVRTKFKYKVADSIGNDEDYIKFVSYMAENELKGKDMVKDRSSIKNDLKLGYQHHQQEVFGLITYDKDNKIIAVDELFKGTRDSSLVDPKVIIKKVLSRDNTRGVAVFHNHPSGNTDPSDADIGVTKRIRRMINLYDIELMDHFVIGKDKTLSFAEEMRGFNSDNKEYGENVKAGKFIRENRRRYVAQDEGGGGKAENKRGRADNGKVKEKESTLEKLKKLKEEVEKNTRKDKVDRSVER